ncbi:MAG: sigma-70 family RNA polymerase sigma factor [Anaerolineaceae bacterium]|nr:MAG: sigma-70 family RNA polymerase sigma factor [Anaerolineaceae bacterium]
MADEQTLIQNAQNGDLEAFNGLVRNYQDAVYTLTYRIMGEPARAADAAQDAFITAFRRLETYNGGNFRAWLMRIAANTCYDHLRYEKRRPATALDDLVSEDYADGAPLPDQSTPTPEQAAQSAELSRAIQSCIDGLQADQRVALIMSDVEDFSYQEIAEAVGVQLGTVKSRISRARAALRGCLQGFRELLPSVYRL